MPVYYDGSHLTDGLHWIWWIFWIALWGVVVYCGWRRRDDGRGAPRESPNKVLQRRLASSLATARECVRRRLRPDPDKVATPGAVSQKNG